MRHPKFNPIFHLLLFRLVSFASFGCAPPEDPAAQELDEVEQHQDGEDAEKDDDDARRKDEHL